MIEEITEEGDYSSQQIGKAVADKNILSQRDIITISRFMSDITLNGYITSRKLNSACRYLVIAWNSVGKERDKLIGTWEKMQKSGDLLQAFRAKQMIEISAQGLIKWEIPELTRTVLERIVIHDKRHFTVRFLDGTSKEVVVE